MIVGNQLEMMTKMPVLMVTYRCLAQYTIIKNCCVPYLYFPFFFPAFSSWTGGQVLLFLPDGAVPRFDLNQIQKPVEVDAVVPKFDEIDAIIATFWLDPIPLADEWAFCHSGWRRIGRVNRHPLIRRHPLAEFANDFRGSNLEPFLLKPLRLWANNEISGI